jgi:hypothetical protein
VLRVGASALATRLSLRQTSMLTARIEILPVQPDVTKKKKKLKRNRICPFEIFPCPNSDLSLSHIHIFSLW